MRDAVSPRHGRKLKPTAFFFSNMLTLCRVPNTRENLLVRGEALLAGKGLF
jgi:hypothetical protein